MSLTSGRNYRVLDMGKSAVITCNPADAPVVYKDFGSTPVVRLSAGFMRMFDLLDIDDRLTVMGSSTSTRSVMMETSSRNIT